MEPFYFGPAQRRLFGIYHPPPSESDRRVGVVLCYPAGQEYIRSHRAFLQLALRLSAAGFHTLRFDYSGCGDSALGSEHGDLGLWTQDTVTALLELREGGDLSRLCLIGLRVGGSIALLTALEQGGVEDLILWDPILNGREYLKEIRRQHQEWLSGSFARTRRSESTPEEVLGFPLTEHLTTSLTGLDLSHPKVLPTERVLLMNTQVENALIPFSKHLEALGTQVEHRYLATPPIWLKQKDELGNLTIPTAVLDSLVDWMARRG